jgi:hypothetical protein
VAAWTIAMVGRQRLRNVPDPDEAAKRNLRHWTVLSVVFGVTTLVSVTLTLDRTLSGAAPGYVPAVTSRCPWLTTGSRLGTDSRAHE